MPTLLLDLPYKSCIVLAKVVLRTHRRKGKGSAQCLSAVGNNQKSHFRSNHLISTEKKSYTHTEQNLGAWNVTARNVSGQDALFPLASLYPRSRPTPPFRDPMKRGRQRPFFLHTYIKLHRTSFLTMGRPVCVPRQSAAGREWMCWGGCAEELEHSLTRTHG